MGIQEKIFAVRCLVVNSQYNSIHKGVKPKIPNPHDKFFLTDVKAFNPKGLCFQARCRGLGIYN